MAAMRTSSAIWSRLKLDTPAARSLPSRTSCSSAAQLQRARGAGRAGVEAGSKGQRLLLAKGRQAGSRGGTWLPASFPLEKNGRRRCVEGGCSLGRPPVRFA
jgi:hypothetical protein